MAHSGKRLVDLKLAGEAAKAPAVDIEQVLYTAAELFAERGYNGVSTREIAKACGCRLPSIYYHFGSKETLYAEAFANRLEDTIDDINDRIDVTAHPEQKMRQMVAAFFDLLSKDSCLLLLVQRDIAEASVPEQAFLCRPQHRYFLKVIGQLIADVQGRPADPNLVIIVHGMLLGYCEFYHLVQETGHGVPRQSDAQRLASLQDAVLKVLV